MLKRLLQYLFYPRVIPPVYEYKWFRIGDGKPHTCGRKVYFTEAEADPRWNGLLKYPGSARIRGTK